MFVDVIVSAMVNDVAVTVWPGPGVNVKARVTGWGVTLFGAMHFPVESKVTDTAFRLGR